MGAQYVFDLRQYLPAGFESELADQKIGQQVAQAQPQEQTVRANPFLLQPCHGFLTQPNPFAKQVADRLIAPQRPDGIFQQADTLVLRCPIPGLQQIGVFVVHFPQRIEQLAAFQTGFQVGQCHHEDLAVPFADRLFPGRISRQLRLSVLAQQLVDVEAALAGGPQQAMVDQNFQGVQRDFCHLPGALGGERAPKNGQAQKGGTFGLAQQPQRIFKGGPQAALAVGQVGPICRQKIQAVLDVLGDLPRFQYIHPGRCQQDAQRHAMQQPG